MTPDIPPESLKLPSRLLKSFKRQTVAQAAILLTVISTISKPLGLLREMVIADRFGATALTDAFVVSQNLPTIFGGLIAAALISALIPVFIRTKEQKGELQAWMLASRVFTLLSVVLLLSCLLLYLFAGPVVNFMTPGLEQYRFELTVYLTRFMIPLVFFGTLLGLFTAILNAYQHFLLPAAASLLNNVFMIGAVLLLASRLSIVSLIIGSLGAILVQFFLVSGALLRRKPYLRFNFRWRDPDLARVFKILIPIVIGGSAGVINMIVDRTVASFLPVASISALNYASRLMGIPQAMFIGNLATAVYPTLSLHVARNEWNAFRQKLGKGLYALWYIILPSTAGLVFLAQPLIGAIYQHGAFTAEATSLTAATLLYYALGLFAHAGNSLLSNAFVSLGDTFTPMMLGFLAVGVNVNLNFSFGGQLGAPGLALATSCAALVNFLAMLYFLQKRMGKGILKEHWWGLIKSLAASLLMGGACFLLWGGVERFIAPQGFWLRLILTAAVVIFGVFFYAGLSFLFRISEVQRYWNYLRRILEKVHLRKRLG